VTLGRVEDPSQLLISYRFHIIFNSSLFDPLLDRVSIARSSNCACPLRRFVKAF